MLIKSLKKQINPDDIFTKLICKDCTKELLMVAKFRWKCKTSEKTLNQLTDSLSADELEQLANETCEETISCVVVAADADDETAAESAEVPLDETTDRHVYDEDGHETNDVVDDLSMKNIEYSEETDDVDNDEEDDGTVQYIVFKEQTVDDHLSDEVNIFADIIEECDDDANESQHSRIDGAAADTMPTNSTTTTTANKFEFILVEDDVQTSARTIGKNAIPATSPTNPLAATTTTVVINHSCTCCGAGFMHLNNLRKHMQSHTITDDDDKCQMPSTTTTATPKIIHQKHRHQAKFRPKSDIVAPVPKPKNHSCRYCPKSFISYSLLMTHLRVHTGERPFECSECAKTFATRGGLDLHMRRHTGVKPFECGTCGARFVESSNLRVHQRIHTGERPHQCNHCGRSFARVFLLQIHQRTHTGNQS